MASTCYFRVCKNGGRPQFRFTWNYWNKPTFMRSKSVSLLYKTNRFHVAVRLFSNRSQKTSKCGKNVASCATFLFLPYFDVICDLLLNRRTATWNLFVKKKAATNTSTPPYPPLQKKNDEIGQMDNRNQARWVYFLYFIKKSNILFRCAFLSSVILNSIQCLLERANSQRPKV